MKVCSVCLNCFEDTALSCSEANHGELIETRLGNCQLIDGFRLESLIQADAVSEIYRAVKIISNQEYFVNIIAASLNENVQEIQNLFLKESQIAAQIDDSGVARIFESGILSDGSLFVVSEIVEGQTLDERLKSGKSLSEISAVAIAGQTAEVLETLHSAGLPHRAVNPENIILASDAENNLQIRIKNIDFGGVREKFFCSENFDDEFFFDNLKYFSPEQFAQEETAIDFSTDIYSLGVVLFEMLTGKVPFDGTSKQEIITQQMNAPVPQAQIASFDIRALLSHTLSLALQKTIIGRLKSANSFARQLRHIEQYASRSFSPAVEKILTDEKAKAQNNVRVVIPADQSKENFTAVEPVIASHITAPVKVLLPVEDEEKIPKTEGEKITAGFPETRKESSAFFDANSVSTEQKSVADSFAGAGANEIFRTKSHRAASPQMVTIEEAEKYLDDQMESLLDIGETKTVLEVSAQIEDDEEYFETDDRYHLPDLQHLIFTPNGKTYLGAAALGLLILTGAVFVWQFSFNEKQKAVSNPTSAVKHKENNDAKESISQPDASEPPIVNNETAVIEMPDLPDSKTFSLGENQPTEKNIPVVAKSVSQNSMLKETANAGKLNLKKNTTVVKEKNALKTAAPQNAFPDVKIIIGNKKPEIRASDVFSRPRIVKKTKNLRVF